MATAAARTSVFAIMYYVRSVRMSSKSGLQNGNVTGTAHMLAVLALHIARLVGFFHLIMPD
jgi:hypothetical protein